jgi:hypothetical protein
MKQHTDSGTNSKGDTSTAVTSVNSDAVEQVVVKVTLDGEVKPTSRTEAPATSATANPHSRGAASASAASSSKKTDELDVKLGTASAGSPKSSQIKSASNIDVAKAPSNTKTHKFGWMDHYE